METLEKEVKKTPKTKETSTVDEQIKKPKLSQETCEIILKDGDKIAILFKNVGLEICGINRQIGEFIVVKYEGKFGTKDFKIVSVE